MSGPKMLEQGAKVGEDLAVIAASLNHSVSARPHCREVQRFPVTFHVGIEVVRASAAARELFGARSFGSYAAIHNR